MAAAAAAAAAVVTAVTVIGEQPMGSKRKREEDEVDSAADAALLEFGSALTGWEQEDVASVLRSGRYPRRNWLSRNWLVHSVIETHGYWQPEQRVCCVPANAVALARVVNATMLHPDSTAQLRRGMHNSLKIGLNCLIRAMLPHVTRQTVTGSSDFCAGVSNAVLAAQLIDVPRDIRQAVFHIAGFDHLNEARALEAAIDQNSIDGVATLLELVSESEPESKVRLSVDTIEFAYGRMDIGVERETDSCWYGLNRATQIARMIRAKVERIDTWRSTVIAGCSVYLLPDLVPVVRDYLFLFKPFY